jgi:hypothetical protein
MASKSEPVGPSQNYQRFAWGTLALAGVVALFSTDNAEPAAGATVAQAATTELAPAPAKLSRADLNPTAPVAMADAESDEGEGQAIGGEGDGEAAPAASPVTDPALGDAEAKAPSAGPASAAAAGQLMASSRNRSGGVNQGDEPIRVPVM